MATPIAARGAVVGGFVNSVTFSAVPTGSGADRVALVALGATNVNDTPVSVVAGGTDNLAAQGSLLTDGNGWQFRLFAVELTVEGNQDFVCTWDDGFNVKLAALVILPSSALPIGDLTTASALTSSTQPTWTIDSATGDTVVALFFLDDAAAFTPSSPATELTGTGLGGGNNVHGMYRDGASPSATIEGSVGGATNVWRGFGFNVPASGGGGPNSTLAATGPAGTLVASSSVAATSTLAATGPAGTLTASSSVQASITSEPIKDNLGILLASTPLDYVAVYNATTGALVARVTGLSTNASGIFVLSHPSLVAGTTYRLDWETSTGKRRMPLKAAA